MTRDEHLDWCKKRALEYLPDNPREAASSMISDLRKHEELADHIGLELGVQLLFGGFLERPKEVEDWIRGFN